MSAAVLQKITDFGAVQGFPGPRGVSGRRAAAHTWESPGGWAGTGLVSEASWRTRSRPRRDAWPQRASRWTEPLASQAASGSSIALRPRTVPAHRR
jgi:hypothetical protein